MTLQFKAATRRLPAKVSLDSVPQSIANIKHAKIREIESTLDYLDEKTLRRVVDLFARAILILFAAVA